MDTSKQYQNIAFIYTKAVINWNIAEYQTNSVNISNGSFR